MKCFECYVEWDYENTIRTDRVVTFGENYAEAASHLEEDYGNDLVSFSIMAFEGCSTYVFDEQESFKWEPAHYKEK